MQLAYTERRKDVRGHLYYAEVYPQSVAAKPSLQVLRHRVDLASNQSTHDDIRQAEIDDVTDHHMAIFTRKSDLLYSTCTVHVM